MWFLKVFWGKMRSECSVGSMGRCNQIVEETATSPLQRHLLHFAKGAYAGPQSSECIPGSKIGGEKLVGPQTVGSQLSECILGSKIGGVRL